MSNKISTSDEMLAEVTALSVTCRSAHTFWEKAEIINRMLRVYEEFEAGQVEQLMLPDN